MKKMRCVVVVPGFSDFYASPRRWASLGARIVCRLLEQAGVEAVLFDAFALRPKGSRVTLPPELTHLEPYLLDEEYGPTAFFSRFQRFGLDAEQLAEQVAGMEPDAVLVSLFAWCYAGDALDTARALRDKLPGVPLLIGGAGASVNPGYFLCTGLFDGVVCGEAEESIAGVVGWLRGGQQPEQLLTRAGQTPPLPGGHCAVEPAAALAWQSKRRSKISLSLTRGCAARCAFCANRLVHGGRFRTAPLEKVKKMLNEIAVQGAVEINFEDDNLLLDKEYFRRAVDCCEAVFPGFEFSAENGLDYRLLEEEDVRFLKEHRFRSVNLSLGTVSTTNASVQQRMTDTTKYEQVMAALEKYSFPVTTYFICGMNGDTPRDALQNLRYLSDKPTLIGVSPFYAVPGLPDYPALLPAFERPGRSRGSALWPWSGAYTTAQLMTVFRLSRLLNLIKSGSVDPLHRQLVESVVRRRRLYTLRRSVPGGLAEVHGMDNEMVEQVAGWLEKRFCVDTAVL